MISFTCTDCNDVDSVYVASVRIDWNPTEQDFDIDSNDKWNNLRCGNCDSWNIEEYQTTCCRCSKDMEPVLIGDSILSGSALCTICLFEVEG